MPPTREPIPDGAPLDPHVYVNLKHLVRLEGVARGLTLLPRQPSGSVLNGKHSSRIRGRGLNFEEIRDYFPGDDVRTIDWKVTARKGKPHVRVFTEEKDRPALIVVDQRMSMFFGTKLNMKSVTAAEAAALVAWQILAAGDRVGGIVFDDNELIENRPQRSRKNVHGLLSNIVQKNNALHADAQSSSDPFLINHPLQAAARLAGHDHLIVFISDFDGVDNETHRYVSRLSKHNDVILVLVHDPVSLDFQIDTSVVISDGHLQIELDSQDKAAMESVKKFAGSRLQRILDWQSELGIAVLPLSAGEPTAQQIAKLLGSRSRR